MRGRDYLDHFYAYLLITVSFVDGAVLADNLAYAFFWEGLLALTSGLIAIGNKAAFKPALKALIIMGCGSLPYGGDCAYRQLAGTLAISKISLVNTLGCVAFVLLIIGAIAKAGSMPFHSWIPDAA